MNLVHIWNAQFAWRALSAFKVSPAFSYRLMTYGEEYDAEMVKADKLRVQVLYAASGKEVGSDVTLEPGTPEFNDYIVKFNEALNVESVLDVFGMDLPGLIAEISVKPENALSKDDMKALEPIFVVAKQ